MEDFGQEDEVVDFGQEDQVFSDGPVPQGGQENLALADLPAPNPNMFAQMNDEEAKLVYDAYSRHPKAQKDEHGNLLYKGIPVPSTEGGIVSDVLGAVAPYSYGGVVDKIGNWVTGGDSSLLEDSSEGIAGGIYNAGKNFVETATAAATGSPIMMGYDYLTGSDHSNPIQDAAVGAVQDYIPEYNPEGTAENAGEVVGEIGVGVLAGNKLAAGLKAAGFAESAIVNIAEKSGRVSKYLSKLAVSAASQAAGTATTLDENSDTLAVGPNAMIPILRGLDGLSESEAQSIAEKRLNIFFDNMLLAAPIDMAADFGKTAWGVVKDGLVTPVLATASDAVKEDVVMEQFVHGLRIAIDPSNPNSAKADEYVSKVIASLSNDEDAVIVVPGLLKQGPHKVELNTATTVARGLDGDESIEAANTKMYLDRKQKEIIDNPGVQATSAAAERPRIAAEKLLDEGVEVKGGDKAIHNAGTAVQTSGRNEVEEAFGKAASTSEELEKTKQGYGQILAEDKNGLGERLLNEANSRGSDYGVVRNKITRDIVDATRGGIKELSEVRKTKWTLPEGLPVNEVELNDAIEKAAPYLDGNTKDAFLEAGIDVNNLDDAAETVADFAKLQNNLRLPLSKAIKRAQDGGSGYKQLLELKKNITDVQPEWLGKQRSKGAKAGKKALDEAVAFDTDVYGPDVNSGIPRKIKDIDKKYGQNKVSATQEAKLAFERAATSEVSDEMEHYANVLAKGEFGGNPGLLVQHAMAKTAEKMSATLRAGGVAAIKPQEIIKTLAPYRLGLNANPKVFAKELKQLDDFETALLANQNNVGKLEELVKQYTKDAEKIEKDVYEGSLKDFLTKEGKSLPNVEKSFKDLFLDEQATSKLGEGNLDNVIKRLDPGAREGAVGAWYKIVKGEIFNPDGTLNTTKAANITNAKNQVMTVGRKLLGEEEQGIVDILEELLDPAIKSQVSKKAASIKSPESMASSAAAKRAANRMVLATVGPLTKVGGRITSFVGTLLDKLKPDEARLRIADAIMADRKEFLRLFKNYSAKHAQRGENSRALFNWLVKTQIYNESASYEKWKQEVKSLETDTETDEAFGE